MATDTRKKTYGFTVCDTEGKVVDFAAWSDGTE